MGSNQRILLTGATGQVGWELHRTLSPLGKVLAPDRNLFDLSRPNQIGEKIREWKPDLIVNPGAYTAVDQAESDHEIAFRVNAEAPKVLAEEASRLGIPLIHYSTDYVFDGKKRAPYSEDDKPNPLNVYGESKLMGERYVQEKAERHLIFRTSWIYGMRGNNFLTTMLRLFQERDKIQVVDDQTGAPTWSRMVAEATAIVVNQMLSWRKSESPWGLYHLAATGQTSWFGFSQQILDGVRSAQSDGGLKDGWPRLVPIPSDGYPLPAERPTYSLLSSEKLARQFGIRLPGWDEQLRMIEIGEGSAIK